jgi:phosphoribosylamine--glycine ligase
MHTGEGFKVLERNSRGGNTEFVNLLTTIEDDPFDICFRILDGSLRGIRFRDMSSVVTCVVPESYGVAGAETSLGSTLELGKAYDRVSESAGRLKVYPMDVHLEGGECRIGTSRSVAVVGIGESVEDARASSLAGARLIRGRVRHREDIASAEDVQRSRAHLARLRRAAS